MSEAAESVSLRPVVLQGQRTPGHSGCMRASLKQTNKQRMYLWHIHIIKDTKIQHTFKTLILGNLYVYSVYLGKILKIMGKILKNTELC